MEYGNENQEGAENLAFRPNDRNEPQVLPDILPSRTRPDLIPSIKQRYWSAPICGAVIIVAVILSAVWWLVNGHIFDSKAENDSFNKTTLDKHGEGGLHN